MKTHTIIELLDTFLGGERVKRSRRERAVQELLTKLEKKEKKLLEKIQTPHDDDEMRHLELKLQVNRAHQEKAKQALDSWTEHPSSHKT